MTSSPAVVPTGRLTIRLRMALWYGITLLAMLLGAVAMLRLQLRRTLEHEFALAHQHSGTVVQQFFQLEIAEYHSIDITLRHIAAEAVFPDRLLAFRQPDGQPFASEVTNSLAKRIRLAEPVRVLALPLDPVRAPGWTLEVRASAADVTRAQRDFDRFLLVSIPLLVLIAGSAGWWLTGRTLRPIALMADAADTISVAGSAGRLPIAAPHDELGRLGTRFNLLLDRLDAALGQQRRFLADAAHELRTPIARMRSTIDLARISPAGPEDRTALDEVSEDLSRTSILLGELLQLARADADPHEVQRSALFLDDVVMDALAPWRSPARHAQVMLTTSQLEETPVLGDGLLLARLVGILVDNGIRYTPAGGTIDVRVRREGDRAVLEVADTGIGIAEDDRTRAFDRFYRGSAARRIVPEGTGLGLPIAAWIGVQHGGTLTLEAGPQQGTVARLSLPIALSTSLTDAERTMA